ncbi:MAG: primosomal protein N' [Pyrinomonadaceae bacterium]|nr:primosomal protein N' [Pyrinomonadaceae bacterium]
MSKPRKTLPSDDKIRANFLDAALPIPLRQTFTYRIPSGLSGTVKLGARVVVPFGKRKMTAYVVGLSVDFDPSLGFEESAVKEILELLDLEPLVTPEILELCRWTSEYYLSSFGEVLKASLPAGINKTAARFVAINGKGREHAEKQTVKPGMADEILALLAQSGEMIDREIFIRFAQSKANRSIRQLERKGFVDIIYRTIEPIVKSKKRKIVRLAGSGSAGALASDLSKKHHAILDVLRTAGGELQFTELLEKADVGASPIKTLEKRGLLEIFSGEVRRDPLENSLLPAVNKFDLTAAQTQVLEQITKSLRAEQYRAFLLHGVTGSGKTEVYIRAIKETLAAGRSALMLVPEIALTPVFSKRLRAVFGDSVAILHSSLSTGERYDEWRRLRKGEARIAIGTRSAVFAPLENVGLIIVDEEHDGSYRQHEMPFYHGRDVAIKRAYDSGGVVILGSATPALETFHNAQIGKYEYLELPERIENRPMAAAELIDLREVFKTEGAVILSPQLVEAIDRTHRKGEQSIILLNRRGFSSFVLCRSCGETVRCQNCDISLTFHKREGNLVCHYCGYREKPPGKCPHCEKEFLYYLGEGTEQVEGVLREKFPDLRIARIDRDTTKRKNELENTLNQFDRGEIDMLVGTQMLAKGHDFHNVTLVGVVSVDAGLQMPDFRSAERTFQLLTQVAGRAGRGDLQGKVLIQTFFPHHYALKHARSQSYSDFYEVESKFRKRFNYPPFVVLASIIVKHHDLHHSLETAKLLRECLNYENSSHRIAVMGPAPAALSRLKNEYRFQLIVKAGNRSNLRKILDAALDRAASRGADMKIVFVEVDPVDLM